MLRHARAALCVLIMISGCQAPVRAPQRDDLRDIATELHRSVARVWPRTAEIWPGVDFSNHVLVFTDGKRAWAIDRERMNDAPVDQVAMPGPGGFQMTQWEGRNAVVIRAPDKLPDDVRAGALELFDTASHEQFHTYVQNSWQSIRQEVETRGETYPLRVEPRIYRMLVANELHAAASDPSKRQAHLAAAAHWQATWQTEFPDEAERMRKTDIKEGTAAYFGTMAAGMAFANNPSDVTARRQYVVQDRKAMRDRVFDLEPYTIGAAALLVADELELSVKPGFANNQRTPAQVALTDVAPVTQTIPVDLRERVRAQTEEQNSALSEIMDPFLKAYQDKANPLLSVSVTAQQAWGSFSPVGFYGAETIAPAVTLIPTEEIGFTLPSGTIEVKEMTVGLKGNDFLVPLDMSQSGVELSGDKLTVNTPNLRGSIQVTSENMNGRHLLRAK